MYHGSSSPVLVLHEGLCLTDDPERAAEYAYNSGYVHEVEIDLDALSEVEAEGEWDHDEAAARSDFDAPDYGADVITYDDESPWGRGHRTWRLMTPAALAAVTVAGTRDAAQVAA